MRIFISLDDESGSKRTTRITVPNCTTTTHIINAICKDIRSKKAITIVRLKYEPFNLRVVEGWSLAHYPIKNGSIFLVELCQDFVGEKLPLIQEDSDQYLTERDSISKTSFISDLNHREDIYLEDCLNRIIEAVKAGDLAQIASILKEQPDLDDQTRLSRLLQKKNSFLINQIGDQGNNALHWAIQLKNIDIVSFLLIKGSNPSILTHEERSPLQLAVKKNALDIIKILLEQKLTDINASSKQGTALHMAIRQNHLDAAIILLQHDADVEALDENGLRAVDVCKNEALKELLLKKRKFGCLQKREAPSISKGNIFKVSTYMYRHKLKIMVVNPYKQSLHFENEQNQITSRYPLEKLNKIEKVTERSWLMNQQYFYFKLYFGTADQQELLLGLKHQKTYERWLFKLNSVMEAMEVVSLCKPVSQADQIIQVINDQTNQIVLHKRKIQQQPVSRIFKNQSILNLPFEPQIILPKEQTPILLTPQRSTVPANFQSPSNEHLKYKDSELVVGSVINQCSTTKSPGSQYSFPDIVEESTEEMLAKSLIKTEGSSESRSKFRKQSQKINIISDFKLEDKVTVTYQDFQILKRIGSGSFGQVYLARYLRTNKLYALKVLNKRKLIAKKQLKYAVGEANIMKKLNSPFVITLHYAFQTPLHLYMAIDHCPQGDLAQIIVVRDQLKESTAIFVIAQLILAIQYLHSKNILYRDLKPENILVGSDGYIKLTDFGISKENCFAMSFCGSPAYLSPEMLERKGVGFESDLYGIGAVLFEMVVGQPPYFDQNIDIMFQNIKTGKLRYPSHLSIQIKSLIGKLIEKDPAKRLGRNNFNEIKKHDFFKKLNWKHLAMKRIHAPRELFLNENDGDIFEPVNLEKRQKINLQEDDYGDSSSNMMNKVSNFTFARDPQTTRLPRANRDNLSKDLS